MKTIYSFIGLPASGKGTQAKILAERLEINIVGVGDLIRETISQGSDDPFVVEIKKRYDAGTPQPDSVAIDLVKNYLLSLDKSVIFDNFPFTKNQAEFLEEFLRNHTEWNHKIIYINVAPEVAVKRVISRKICAECGTIYGATDEMICEKCGGGLIVRADDNEDIVRARISHYQPKIREVIDYYESINKPVTEIDGEKTVPEVEGEISQSI